jgi:hypothetical protein
MTEDELRRVLERAVALHHEASEAEFDTGDAIALGRELGIAPMYVTRAMEELLDAPLRHQVSGGVVTASTALSRPARIVETDLAQALRRRTMDPCAQHGRGCWTQRRDWWPDAQRLGGELHVRADVLHLGGSRSEVTLRVDVRLKATGYGAGAGGAAAVLWLVVGPAGLVPALASKMAAPGSAVAAYRRRTAGIGARLEDLLLELR